MNGLPVKLKGTTVISIAEGADKVSLSSTDGPYVYVEVGYFSPQNVEIRLPRRARDGQEFNFRINYAPVRSSASFTGVPTNLVEIVGNVTGYTATEFRWGLMYGQEWVKFVYFAGRGWIPPQGVSIDTNEEGPNKALAWGHKAFAMVSSGTTKAPIVIGNGANGYCGNDGDCIAIGQDAQVVAGAVAIGAGSYADNNSVAVGRNSDGSGDSNGPAVAIGDNAVARDVAVAVGVSSNSGLTGTAVGDHALANGGTAIGRRSDNTSSSLATSLGGFAVCAANERNQVALGAYALPSRSSETSRCLDDSNQKHFISFLGWNGDTANDTPTEIYLNRQTGTPRLTLSNSSAVGFVCNVIARNNADNVTSNWELKGAIRRGANAAATAIVGSVTKTVVAQDGGAAAWDVALTADTTNGALILTVTGEAAKTIRWTARVDLSELRF